MADPVFLDPSLWWDSFRLLLTELENAPLFSDPAPELLKKLEDSHTWFVETVSLFKQPSEKSREYLNSQKLQIGSRTLTIQPVLKDKALKISSFLCLDEVQSYILVERTIENKNLAFSSMVQEFLHVVLLEFYTERQCLLKCTRHILLHALYVGKELKECNIRDKAMKLINDGLEGKLITTLQNLLSSTHPEQMDVDLFTLWAEETLIEENLVLDILFLAYYESFCSCNGERWKHMCLLFKGILFRSYNFATLEVSPDAMHSSNRVKVQLLLLLIQALDLEGLLLMVRDDTPFRKGGIVYTMEDIQEMDAIVSSFCYSEMKEAGPLILAWAVFLCLVSSLPEKQESDVLMDINHVGYVRQAFESASLSSFLDILQSDMLKESEENVAGYRSVLRTFISAFIASYEINLQLEDTTPNLILEIICNIYRGEESLCTQFWDKESFIDGPVRILLCNLEGEFPRKTAELVRILSSLCEGPWPAECVFNFLDKCVGVSSLFETNGNAVVGNIPDIVETQHALNVPGIEGLVIPGKTRGHVLKVVDGKNVLVKWEYKQSGLLVLLMQLAQKVYFEGNEEVFLTLDLLSRMVSFNTAVCFALMNINNSLHVQASNLSGQMEKRIWVVEVLCNLISNLPPNPSNAAILSLGVNILSKMLKCSPSDVAATSLKSNFFVTSKTSTMDICSQGAASGSWIFSGKLEKMLLIDCEHNDNECPLTVSVLDFTMHLVEAGLDNDVVLALIAICFQYILVNHEYWKFKVKQTRWKVTIKVLEVMKRCILAISEKVSEVVLDMLLSDSSIHNVFFRIICTTRHTLEKLYVSRLFDQMEIEGLECAICSVLDIFFIVLSKFSKKDLPSGPSLFHQALVSPITKPVPVSAAVISLISYSRNSAMQVGAARVLSIMLMISNSLQTYLYGKACFSFDDEQVSDLRLIFSCILSKDSVGNDDLFIAVVNLLTSAALYQPAFLVTLFANRLDLNVQVSDAEGVKHPSDGKSSLVDVLLNYLDRLPHNIDRPQLLLNVLNFIKVLWQVAGQCTTILDLLKGSGNIWKKISNYISLLASEEVIHQKKITAKEALDIGYRYQCLSSILETISYNIFLEKNISHLESLVKPESVSDDTALISLGSEKPKALRQSVVEDILSTWCESSLLDKLIRSCASCEYEHQKYFHAKVATSLVAVYVMEKWLVGNGGSLSVSLLEEIKIIFKKLISLPAFSELSATYLRHGYSQGNEVKSLILSDLYYHLQGELEGRHVASGPFKELLLYLTGSKLFQSSQRKSDKDSFLTSKNVYLFDLEHIEADLGLHLWGYTDWKESKVLAEKMLFHMQEVNSMLSIHSSKLAALRTLSIVLVVNGDSFLEQNTTKCRRIPDQPVLSWIDHICECLNATVKSLAFVDDGSQHVLDFLEAQAELLLHLMRSVLKSMSLPLCSLVLKTSGAGLKVLIDIRKSITSFNKMMNLFLMILLSALELSGRDSQGSLEGTMEYAEDLSPLSNVTAGLLPVLCNCINTVEQSNLALATLDLILKRFLGHDSWLPVIQSHFPLQHVILKLHDINNFDSVHVMMNFFLTLARVRGGAEMLISSWFLTSLRVLLNQCWEAGFVTEINCFNKRNQSNLSDKTERARQIWGISLAVVTAIIISLGDTSSCVDILETAMNYFFSEKVYMISYYLSTLDFPSDFHDKKRPTSQKVQISLSALKDTEQTLVLMCLLGGHWNSWRKVTKEMDSQLREKCIHLLAFISRGAHRYGESSAKNTLFFCPPILKEEIEYCEKPSYINSNNAWFALSSIACILEPKFSSISNTKALVIKGQMAENRDSACQTYFSDIVATTIYRITFFILKFLCIQVDGAARRAEEVGYFDLAHFPELPMPEILHGLQGQVIAILNELYENNQLKLMHPDLMNICSLLLQIMEMTLYLELCVLQICGIRPVLGRMEDFSKEIKLLFKVMEKHEVFKEPTKSLKQIISFLYPGLLQSEGLL